VSHRQEGGYATHLGPEERGGIEPAVDIGFIVASAEDGGAQRPGQGTSRLHCKPNLDCLGVRKESKKQGEKLISEGKPGTY
jgi:hypothetical protein